MEFFHAKIKTVRDELTATAIVSSKTCTLDGQGFLNVLECFAKIKGDDLAKVFKSMKKNSSSNDPIPPRVLGKCCESVSEFILKIANLSVSTGCFPCQLKHVAITPILKGKELESDELKPIER